MRRAMRARELAERLRPCRRPRSPSRVGAARSLPRPRSTTTPAAPAATACAGEVVPVEALARTAKKSAPGAHARGCRSRAAEDASRAAGAHGACRRSLPARERVAMATALMALELCRSSRDAPVSAAPRAASSRRRSDAWSCRGSGSPRGPCRRSRRRRPARRASPRDRRAPIDAPRAAVDVDDERRWRGTCAHAVQDHVDDRARILGARVVAGDDREVGARGDRARPSSAAWCGSRSPPQPNTQISRPRVSGRSAASTRSSASGVCA